MSGRKKTPPRRLSMKQRIIQKEKQRKRKEVNLAPALKRGWQEMDLGSRKHNISYETLDYPPESTTLMHNIRRNATPADVFCAICPGQFLFDIMQRRKVEHPRLFVRSRGGNRNDTNIQFSVRKMQQMLAHRILIQGRQDKPTEAAPNPRKLDQSFKSANEYLKSKAKENEPLIGWKMARTLNSNFVIKVGTEDEKELRRHWQSPFHHIGEVLCCDEKVFHFDSRHQGLIRVVPAKKEVGPWNYTACGFLENNSPYCLYSRCHVELSNLDEKVPTSEVMMEWAELTLRLTSEEALRATIVADSYYLSQEALQQIDQSGAYFLCAIQKQRFEPICDLIDARVQKSGDMAFALRQRKGKTDMLVSCHHSPDSRIKKRFTLTNALVEVSHKRRKAHVPGFSEYADYFADCDFFSRLHQKNWPHKYYTNTYNLGEVASHDFLFTVTLLNATTRTCCGKA